MDKFVIRLENEVRTLSANMKYKLPDGKMLMIDRILAVDVHHNVAVVIVTGEVVT